MVWLLWAFLHIFMFVECFVDKLARSVNWILISWIYGGVKIVMEENISLWFYFAVFLWFKIFNLTFGLCNLETSRIIQHIIWYTKHMWDLDCPIWKSRLTSWLHNLKYISEVHIYSRLYILEVRFGF